ncbi:MAG: sodium:solute symporter [Planctomycetota bacterium]
MLAILCLYVLAQLVLGLWIARRVRTEDDYLVAGRRLGPVLAISSMFATWFGAESCIGAAGAVYEEGAGLHSVEPFAYGMCLVLLGAVFAARLWRAGITTLADLFQQRIGGSTATIAAVLMVPTSLLWAAAQVRAFGHVVAVNSGGLLGEEAALAAAALVVVLYTGAGGLLADVVTDLVQGVLLVLGLVLLLGAVVWALGGPAAAVEAAQALPERAPAEPLGGLELLELWAIPLCGSVVAQEAIARALAARSPGLARTAGIAGGGLYLLIGLVPVALGLLGPLLVTDLGDAEQLLPTLARDHAPGIVHVLFTGALVSAMLSTVDSSLLAASSVLTRNLVVRQRPLSPEARLRTARLSAVACGLAAWALAHLGDGVSDLVEQASGFGSAGIFVVMLAALYGRGVPPRAANLAMLGGVSAWVLGSYVFDGPLPYLGSLAAAAGGLGLGLLLPRRGAKA